MLFNSIDFAIFLPVVFLLYWFVVGKSLRLQNFLIVGASYLFYGWWDWRFLGLLFLSTLVDYAVGILLSRYERPPQRKMILWCSLLFNLGLLGFFKYSNFFIENFREAFSFFGSHLETSSLQIILPVGISFYTFQSLSYTIDVYKRKLEPTRDFIAFAAFVSFFPQLVAGPIERARHLLPQFCGVRTFTYTSAVDGLRQMLWGLFKKVVIADNCAEYANIVFNHFTDYSGSTLALGAVFFAIQIYCDFSGYSDIAIGTARLFGFDLIRNFAFPYFSRDMSEFWRRWHISLSTWFREYVYIPLGGSKHGVWIQVRNIAIVFFVSGFWHGASWTYVAWGALNALYVIPLIVLKQDRDYEVGVAHGRHFPSFRELAQMGVTFCLTTLAWIFFRSQSMAQALRFVSEIFSYSFFKIPEGRLFASVSTSPFFMIVALMIFILVEWLGRDQQHALAKFGLQWPALVRYNFYYILILALFFIGGGKQDFIYFQF